MWRGGGTGMSPALLALIALIGAAAIAGSCLVAFTSNAPDLPEPSGLRINEIVSDNASALITETGEVPDWIELQNAGSEPLELRGYTLLLGTEVNKIFAFPEGTLEPGACTLVYCEGMAAGAEHGDWSAPFRLPASGGEALTLFSPGDVAVDSVELPELGENEAYARGADGAWERRETASPGVDNDSFDAAEAQLRLAPGAVELNEVSTRNTLYFADENGEYHDYVELRNCSGGDVNLRGWYLSDDSARLKRWAFPDVTLPAGGCLAVHCSGYDRVGDARHLHTNFKLGEGESVYLSRPDGQPASMASPPELAADQAWSLVDGAWSAELAPTPGAENTAELAARMNAQRFGSAAVQLSEVMASAASEPCDWIEIRNVSNQAVDLSGYGLSDDSNRPRRWQFPQGTTIQPGEYMGVLLSGRKDARTGQYLNADFAISALGGSTIALADPSGRVLDAVYLPKQYGGKSYGRIDGEEGFFYFDAGTPLAANAGTHYRSRAAVASCSVSGGLYATGQNFSVALEAPAGSRVYYTLDGSDPDETSTLYAGPIPVSGTTILRSRVYRDGCMPSLIDTQSYLYDVRNESSVYVVSLVTDMDNLVGPENGIMTPENLMRNLEREGHVEIFLPDGTRVISQGCGISLHGGGSRKLPVKSFNVIARNEYGSNRFNYPLFSHRDYDAYQSILLRPSGEDQDMSLMRDSVLSALMRGSSLMFQESEICVVYANGEYYTLCYLRERINKFGICQFEDWQGMEDEIDIVKGNDVVIQGSNSSFKELLQWVRENDMDTEAAFDYLDARIDVQNYIEYMAAEIFSGNADLLNVRRYRNAKADGKWRWALFDLDWGFYNDVNSIERWLNPGGTGSLNATDNTLFIACMSNPTFRDRFLTYLGEMLAGNFSSEYVVARFQERYERIEPMLDQYRQRWNYELSGVSRLMNYAQTRPAKLIGYFQETLRLSDAAMERYFGAAMQKIRESEEGDG